eukprot:1154788-Pelagomonas_calceolata.AAC.4
MSADSDFGRTVQKSTGGNYTMYGQQCSVVTVAKQATCLTPCSTRRHRQRYQESSMSSSVSVTRTGSGHTERFQA